ncbi:hypothetical protein HGA64_00590, partial [Candidatus Falkowbacteria bacterium]|nr:hypothetical protein [Candidatus Falkowbacteria bacterium]
MRQIKKISLAVLFLSLAFSSPAFAVEYGGIGGRPAYPRTDNQRTESIFVHTLTPGQTQEDGIKVINNTAERKTIMVYAVDSVVSSGGAFSCAQLGDAKSGVGSWIKLSKEELVLDSVTSEIVPFSITAPQAVDVGEHNGCIIIQERKDAASSTSGVSLSFRTGLRVALLVPGEIKKNIEITGFDYGKRAGLVNLHPSVKNSGNVSLDSNVELIATDMLGRQVAKFGGTYPVLRGEPADWNFEFKNPYWGGLYKAALTVSYDASSEGEIGKKDAQQIKSITGPTISFFVMPATLALATEVGVIILLLVLLALLLVKMRRNSWIKKDWVAYEVKEGEDIKSLAERHGISWKWIAQ